LPVKTTWQAAGEESWNPASKWRDRTDNAKNSPRERKLDWTREAAPLFASP